MEFGIQLNPYVGTRPWERVAEAARLLDESRFASVWLYDHLLFEGDMPGHPTAEPVLECFTTLGAIAAITRRIRLGQLVLAVPYRNPALVVKMATTLDHVSRGRAILGLGAGWHQREHEGYGYGALEPVPVRMRRLEEALRLVQALWGESPASFEGEFYRVEGVRDAPAPLQRPHPPILVGGSGERVSLRLAAQYGQWCNVTGGVEKVGHLFGVLREHCARLGRPYADITRSAYITVLVGRDEADTAARRERYAGFLRGDGVVAGTPEQIVPAFEAYARAGCQHAILRMLDWSDLDTIQRFSDVVIPALSE